MCTDHKQLISDKEEKKTLRSGGNLETLDDTKEVECWYGWIICLSLYFACKGKYENKTHFLQNLFCISLGNFGSSVL